MSGAPIPQDPSDFDAELDAAYSGAEHRARQVGQFKVSEAPLGDDLETVLAEVSDATAEINRDTARAEVAARLLGIVAGLAEKA